MKYYLNTLIFFLLFSYSFSQNSLGKTDDIGRVKLSTYVSDQIDGLPASAKNLLENKLSQITSINGLGGTRNSRFIITPNVSLLFKEVLPGPPRKVVITLDVYFYIGDGIKGTVFSSETIKVKGVGTSDTKAYISAIKQIKARNPIFKDFVNQGKTEIIEFYNSQCDFILKDAEVSKSKKDYDGAIYKLMEIPQVTKECYETAMNEVAIVYKEKMDYECQLHLTNAKNAWNTGLDTNSANIASTHLSLIDPDSNCYEEGVNLSKLIGKRIKELDQREWDFKMKKYEDEVEKENSIIKAARDIGVANAKNQPKVTYNIRSWW
ncbi:hypothetical protein FG167_11595 [Lacinutrix sp. WUR7]|uniref:hypothetical protein n=1 Tax=Lacinutrix sp. WUR7 TaxID=2653681 RepID=UPI00193DF2C5|nr:hypothetical protein [Lacinutrix sp. WUR7]QRM89845.1 hypothetical protein FG167_11595 [Lacinutrix sp. WUR7]